MKIHWKFLASFASTLHGLQLLPINLCNACDLCAGAGFKPRRVSEIRQQDIDIIDLVTQAVVFAGVTDFVRIEEPLDADVSGVTLCLV